MVGKKRRGRLRWLLWTFIALLFLAGAAGGFVIWRLTTFFSRDAPDVAFVETRFDADERPRIDTYDTLGLRVRAVRAGLSEGPRILFIHGSPGSWRDYSGYFSDAELRTQAQLLAFDRPGFGETGGAPEPSLKRQAALATPLLSSGEGTPTLVVGYSLGGPVAAQLAVDLAPLVDALVLIAPSIDPDLEEPRWYNRIAAVPGMQYLLPRVLIHSNREILPLKNELLKLRDKLSGFSIPTIVIQGLEDRLVPPENADFVEELMPEARIVRVPDVGHGILWQSRKLITREILELLTRLSGN